VAFIRAVYAELSWVALDMLRLVAASQSVHVVSVEHDNAVALCAAGSVSTWSRGCTTTHVAQNRIAAYWLCSFEMCHLKDNATPLPEHWTEAVNN
jgi:hypothetical protein